MATFKYKLEFIYDENAPADAAVFIQMRDNPPVYQDHIDKEVYEVEGPQSDFLTGLFDVPGVVEVSVRAYRIWLMKSPVYTWKEVLEAVLAYLTSYYSYDSAEPLAGSANVDGTGFTLTGQSNRRKI